MSKLIEIQPSIFCEPCIICGARPAIEQVKDKFVVRCSANAAHYKTQPGLVDIDRWNKHNHRTPDADGNIKRLKHG